MMYRHSGIFVSRYFQTLKQTTYHEHSSRNLNSSGVLKTMNNKEKTIKIKKAKAK